MATAASPRTRRFACTCRQGSRPPPSRARRLVPQRVGDRALLRRSSRPARRTRAREWLSWSAIIGARWHERSPRGVCVDEREHLGMAERELRDLFARQICRAPRVVVRLRLRRKHHAPITDEYEPHALLVRTEIVINREDAEHADELLGFFDRLANDRGDEVLAGLHTPGRQVPRPVAFLDDEVAVLIRDDGEDEHRTFHALIVRTNELAVDATWMDDSCIFCMNVAGRFSGDLVEHARAFGVLAAEVDVPGAGAFERAARKLHLDTSVLRRRLQALVDYAGGPLLTGRGRELRLTPLGARVRGVSTQLVELAAAMHTHASLPERVVVGCTEA